MEHFLLRCVPLLALLLTAAVLDLRERRIPNWLSLLLIGGGILQSCCRCGLIGPGASLLGIFAGAAIPFVMFAIGALGAGDVKLMAGAGAWLGAGAALAVFVLAALVGLFIVIVQAAMQGRLRILFRNSAVVALNLLYVREVGVEHARATGQSAKSVGAPLPYAVPVLAAVILVMLKMWSSG
jgi:prepilin peptidase CpaA